MTLIKHTTLKKIILFVCVILMLSSCSVNNEQPTDVQVIPVNPTNASTAEITTESITNMATETITTEVVERTYEDYLMAHLEDWGLGKTSIAYVSNDRTYEWYIDQGDTGEHSNNNCGPTTIAMVGKWVDQDFPVLPEDARAAFRPQGGWWYSEDISGSLELYGIDYSSVEIKDHYTLRNIIDSGQIAIINNTMNYIPYTSDENLHVGRFYTFDSGHYLIVKGYLMVDDKLYFEMYDPNNWWMTYADGSPMGKNRYYDAESLMASITNWYPIAVVIKANDH